jgi:hypothetical protein
VPADGDFFIMDNGYSANTWNAKGRVGLVRIYDAELSQAEVTANFDATKGDGYLDSTAPTVTSVSASTADGSYNAGDTVNVEVNFSENVTVTGTPQLTLRLSPTNEVVNYASGSGTSTLVFTYTVQAGDTSPDLDYVSTTSLDLNGGSIRDAAANNATLTLPTPGATNSLGANKAIVIDTTAPTVTLARSAATATAASISFTVTGDEAIDCTTLSTTTGTDFDLAGISGITAITQTSSTVCTVTATSTATAGGGPVTSTLTEAATFEMTDAAGNAQANLVDSPQSIVVTIASSGGGGGGGGGDISGTTTTTLATTTTTTTSTTSTTTTTTSSTSSTTTSVPAAATSLPRRTTTTTALSTSTTAPRTASATSTVPSLPRVVTSTTSPIYERPDAGVNDTTTTSLVPPTTVPTTPASGPDPAFITLDDEVEVVIQGVDANEAPSAINPDGRLILTVGNFIKVRGKGFTNAGFAEVWLFSTPQLLGRVPKSASGEFIGRVRVPDGMANGDHTIELRARTRRGRNILLSVPAVVIGGVATTDVVDAQPQVVNVVETTLPIATDGEPTVEDLPILIEIEPGDTEVVVPISVITEAVVKVLPVEIDPVDTDVEVRTNVSDWQPVNLQDTEPVVLPLDDDTSEVGVQATTQDGRVFENSIAVATRRSNDVAILAVALGVLAVAIFGVWLVAWRRRKDDDDR